MQRTRPMTPEDLRRRTAEFARRATEFARPLLSQVVTSDVARQFLRAAAGAAANYRAAGRGRAHGEFVAKLGLALEEADEAQFWLEHLRDSRLVVPESLGELTTLLAEAGEIVAIFTASRTTAARSARASQSPRSRRG